MSHDQFESINKQLLTYKQKVISYRVSLLFQRLRNMWGGNQMIQQMCNYCQGSGRHFTSDCPSCRGQGSVMVPSYATQCNRCNGSGKEFTSICHICGGSGWSAMPNHGFAMGGMNQGMGNHGMGMNQGHFGMGMNQGMGIAQTMKVSCKLCRGDGRYFTSDCQGCCGAGSVMVASPPQDCAKCHGSGKHFTDICSACGGCGYANRM